MLSCEVCGKEDLLGYEMANVCKPCAANIGGTQPTVNQQLKPEMPSFADVTKDVQFMTVDEGNKAFVVYSNLARHFGRRLTVG